MYGNAKSGIFSPQRKIAVHIFSINCQILNIYIYIYILKKIHYIYSHIFTNINFRSNIQIQVKLQFLRIVLQFYEFILERTNCV